MNIVNLWVNQLISDILDKTDPYINEKISDLPNRIMNNKDCNIFQLLIFMIILIEVMVINRIMIGVDM